MDKKWHALELGEIEKQLNTSLEGGISVKEARARLDAEKRRADGERYSLFVPRSKSSIRTILHFFRIPCMTALILMSLMAFILGAYFGALLILLTAVLGAASCGIILLNAEKKQEDMYEFASPMVKVKRSGSIMYTDGRNAVEGDIIVLKVGDILPCDARIISSKDLIVRELIHTKDGIRNRDIEKHACNIEGGEGVNAPNAINMLYAGSAVIEGEAVAVVVSTADNVYLYEYCNDSLLRTSVFSDGEMTRLDIFFRKVQLISFISLTVLTVLSMLTMKGEGFLSVFLMLLASLSMVSLEVVRAVKVCIFSSLLDRMSKGSKRKRDAVAYIRDIKTLESLSEVTDIVLLGKAAFTHGTYHIGEVWLSGEATAVSTKGEAENRLMSYIYTYIKALDVCGMKTEIVLDGVADSLNDHLKNIKFDKKGADLVLNTLYFAPNEDGTGGYACAETPEAAYRIILTYDREYLTYCSYLRMSDRKLCKLDGASADSLDKFEKSSVKACGKSLYVISETNGIAVLEGAISIIETAAEDIDAISDGVKEMGIRIIPMMSDEVSGALLYSSRAFSEKIAYAEEFKSNGYDITHGFGQYTAYVGFSDDEFAVLIEFMRKAGSVVAAYGVGNEYYGTMSHSDIAISCDIIKYSSQKYRESVYERLPCEGRDANIRCSQKTRFLSKILVHRANRAGGGLESIRRAVRKARGANVSLSGSLLYYASIMSIVLPFSVMSSVLGIELLNGVQTTCLALSSVILAANVFAGAEPHGELMRNCSNKGLGEILGNKKNTFMLILRASLASLVAISVKILDSFGIFGENASYSMPIFISIVLIAAAELFLSSLDFSKRNEGRKRTWICFLAVYSSLLIICGVMTQTVFARELFPNGIGTLEYILVLIYPLLHCILLFVYKLTKKTVKKN